MSTRSEASLAVAGVFVGSLIADAVFGDGIQGDDLAQAVLVAAVAAMIQVWLARKRGG